MSMTHKTIDIYLTELDKKSSVMLELTDVNRLIKGLKEKELRLDPVLVEGGNGYRLRYSDSFGVLYKVKKNTPEEQVDGINHILSLDQHRYDKVFKIDNPQAFYADVIQLAIKDIDDSPTDSGIELAIDNAIRYVGERYVKSVSPRSGGSVGYASSSLFPHQID